MHEAGPCAFPPLRRKKVATTGRGADVALRRSYSFGTRLTDSIHYFKNPADLFPHPLRENISGETRFK